MYAAYHLNVDELDADVIRDVKNTFPQRDIVIVPKDTYDEWKKEREDAAFTEKLRRSMQELDEGKFVVKTMAELEAMAKEAPIKSKFNRECHE